MIREINSVATAQKVDVENIELETPKQSFRTAAFRNSQKSATAEAASAPVTPAFNTSPKSQDDVYAVSRSEKTLACALVNQKLGKISKEELERRLAVLMKSAPIKSVMLAARNLAQECGCTENEAMQQILISMQELHELWDKILAREGMLRLSDS